jgi:hypothetical protein
MAMKKAMLVLLIMCAGRVMAQEAKPVIKDSTLSASAIFCDSVETVVADTAKIVYLTIRSMPVASGNYQYAVWQVGYLVKSDTVNTYALRLRVNTVWQYYDWSWRSICEPLFFMEVGSDVVADVSLNYIDPFGTKGDK